MKHDARLAVVLLAAAVCVLLGAKCSLFNKAPSVPVVTGPTQGVAGVPVEFRATATDPEGDSIAFEFDWGDNTALAWSSFLASGETLTIAHSYADSGSYSIKAKSKDKNGKESRWTEAVLILVVGFGGGLPDSVTAFVQLDVGAYDVALSVSESTLYVAGAQDYLVVVDIASRTVLHEVPTGLSPFDVAVEGAGQYVYVSNSQDSTVTVANADGWRSSEVVVGPRAQGLALTRDGSRLYVACSSPDKVLAMRTSDHALVDTIPVQGQPHVVLLNSDETMVYVSATPGTVSMVRLDNHQVLNTRSYGQVSLMAYASDERRLFLTDTDTTVTVASADNLDSVGVFTVPEHPYSVAVIPGGYVAFAGWHNLYYFDASTLQPAGVVPLGSNSGCTGMVSSTDGLMVFVACQYGVYIVECSP